MRRRNYRYAKALSTCQHLLAGVGKRDRVGYAGCFVASCKFSAWFNRPFLGVTRDLIANGDPALERFYVGVWLSCRGASGPGEPGVTDRSRGARE